MGLMAIFALMMVVQILQVTKSNDKLKDNIKYLEATKETLKKERTEKEKATRQQAVQIAAIIEQVTGQVEAQDNTRAWLAHLFKLRGCPIELEEGELKLGERSEAFYNSGDFRLGVDGRQALEACRQNFLILSVCLSEHPQFAAQCIEELKEAGKGYADQGAARSLLNPQVLNTLRKDVDALVLQGNTDRIGYNAAGGIAGLRVPLSSLDSSFVSNSFLGTERARQALGHLLSGVHGQTKSTWPPNQLNQLPASPSDILMSKIRVESPSFGRYQAGIPSTDWNPLCENGKRSCAAARNLSLHISFSEEALRRPLKDVSHELCVSIGDPEDFFAQALSGQRDDQESEQQSQTANSVASLWEKASCDVYLAHGFCTYVQEECRSLTGEWLQCNDRDSQFNEDYKEQGCAALNEALSGLDSTKCKRAYRAAKEMIFQCEEEDR